MLVCMQINLFPNVQDDPTSPQECLSSLWHSFNNTFHLDTKKIVLNLIVFVSIVYAIVPFFKKGSGMGKRLR